MIRRIGLILALLATLLPISTLIPGVESAVSAGAQATTAATSANEVMSSSVANEPPRLAPGGYHTCAIFEIGTVKCWGANDYGQLGNGTTTPTNRPGNAINLGTGRTATAITAGEMHTCAILDNGTVKCWGWNTNGQLGNGNTTNISTPDNAINLGTGRTATAITAGRLHTCAILDNKTITCWGSDDRGQLGNGTTTNSPRAIINHITGHRGTVALGK